MPIAAVPEPSEASRDDVFVLFALLSVVIGKQIKIQVIQVDGIHVNDRVIDRVDVLVANLGEQIIIGHSAASDQQQSSRSEHQFLQHRFVLRNGRSVGKETTGPATALRFYGWVSQVGKQRCSSTT